MNNKCNISWITESFLLFCSVTGQVVLSQNSCSMRTEWMVFVYDGILVSLCFSIPLDRKWKNSLTPSAHIGLSFLLSQNIHRLFSRVYGVSGCVRVLEGVCVCVFGYLRVCGCVFVILRGLCVRACVCVSSPGGHGCSPRASRSSRAVSGVSNAGLLIILVCNSTALLNTSAVRADSVKAISL